MTHLTLLVVQIEESPQLEGVCTLGTRCLQSVRVSDKAETWSSKVGLRECVGGFLFPDSQVAGADLYRHGRRKPELTLWAFKPRGLWADRTAVGNSRNISRTFKVQPSLAF